MSNYGQCWRPRVDSGWAPYQSGYWTTDYPYGLTWVSNEPWGYAPYHYGRWASVGNQWFWVPDRVRTRPAYSPALVAFIPLQAESIGWVPLAPGDPYAPRYYDTQWTPRYLTRTQVIQERVINLNVPGAVTVVNVRDFSRAVDRRTIEHVDSQQFAHVRPVLDPFAVRNFRDVALRTRGVERRFDVPARVAQQIDRPVLTSTMPESPFRRDLAQSFKVRSVPEKAKGEHLSLRDNRQPGGGGARTAPIAQPAPNLTNPNQANIAAEQERERRIADLSRDAARGNRDARQEMQQLQRQQRQEQQQQREQVGLQQRAARLAAQQAQAERVSNDLRKQRGIDQLRQRQPDVQQPPRANHGWPYMKAIRQPNGQPAAQPQKQSAPRQLQRQQQPQAQPRDRQRSLAPPLRQPANRAQPSRPQAAPQPQSLRVQRQPQGPPQRKAQPQPQAQRQPAQLRQQQQQPPPQKQQLKSEGRTPEQPAMAPAAAEAKNKKGREHP